MGTFLLLSLVYICWTVHKIYKKVYNKKNRLEKFIQGVITKHVNNDSNSDNGSADSGVCSE